MTAGILLAAALSMTRAEIVTAEFASPAPSFPRGCAMGGKLLELVVFLGEPGAVVVVGTPEAAG